MTHSVQRIAHRGGTNLAPENTRAAFRNALTLPVDAVELDVQMSSDGKLIVFHDNTVERLTEGTGNILDLNFAMLRSLDAAAHFPGGWKEREQIPTLREVLTLLKGRLFVCIEIKASKREGIYDRYPHIVEYVIDDVQTMGMIDEVLLISFDWQALAEVKKLQPALPTGAIVSHTWWHAQAERPVERLCNQVADLGCEWISMDYRLVSPDVVTTIHERGFKLGVWTVNTLDGIRQMISFGVDSVTSDQPDLFAELA